MINFFVFYCFFLYFSLHEYLKLRGVNARTILGIRHINWGVFLLLFLLFLLFLFL